MPQTIHKTFYACDKCGFEHTEFHNAVMCEQLPLLEEINNLEQYKVGDTIEYQNEEQSFTRWIYGGKSGKIVEKKMVVANNNQDATKHHTHIYWVEDDIGFQDGVVWVKDDFGWKLFSPAELKRRR